MNPVFIILVILVAILLWVLLSFIFYPIGEFICKIIKDTFDIINENDKNNKNNEKKEKN